LRPFGGQCAGGFKAKPAVGAGDNDYFAALVGNIADCPFSGRVLRVQRLQRLRLLLFFGFFVAGLPGCRHRQRANEKAI